MRFLSEKQRTLLLMAQKTECCCCCHFSRVRLCVTPEMAAHQAPLSLGFSRQEHWSGLPFPSPMQEGEKWKWSCSVVPDPQRPHALQPSRLLHPWDFPAKSTGVGCHCLLWKTEWAPAYLHLFPLPPSPRRMMQMIPDGLHYWRGTWNLGDPNLWKWAVNVSTFYCGERVYLLRL